MALFGLTSVIVDFELIGRAIREVARRRRHDLELATEISEQRAAALRTVSHELRTPLTSIGGFAHFLTERELPPDERVEFAHRIVTESTHLNHLVDDLLASASLEAGQLKLEVQPVTVGESARQVAEVFRPRGVDIDIDIDPSHTVSADPARLGQILRNLLSNVEKYGGSAATVSSHRADTDVVLTVSDDGPGVASADRERIFQDFAQVGGASHVTGTGLGLGISRRLAQAMGGDLRCVDAVVGARFELVLPAHA
jgi:signal transduction histidine kinase